MVVMFVLVVESSSSFLCCGCVCFVFVGGSKLCCDRSQFMELS